MGVTAKKLVQSKYASSSTTTEYTVPGSTTTIIDKFTATNTDASARTIDIHIVPLSGSAGADNKIVSALSINANETKDITFMQNQILSTGEFIAVLASVANKVVIRVSGREVT